MTNTNNSTVTESMVDAAFEAVQSERKLVITKLLNVVFLENVLKAALNGSSMDEMVDAAFDAIKAETGKSANVILLEKIISAALAAKE